MGKRASLLAFSGLGPSVAWKLVDARLWGIKGSLAGDSDYGRASSAASKARAGSPMASGGRPGRGKKPPQLGAFHLLSLEECL